MFIPFNNFSPKKISKTVFSEKQNTKNNYLIKLLDTTTTKNIGKDFIYNKPIFNGSSLRKSFFYNRFFDIKSLDFLPEKATLFLSDRQNYRIINFTDNVTKNHINILFISVVRYHSFIFLKTFMRFVLWSLNVPKHRLVFLWLRLFFKNLVKLGFVKNVSIKIKGKLAVTGNKRTRPFYIKYGVFSSTDNINLTSFVVRTPTGVMNFLIKCTF